MHIESPLLTTLLPSALVDPSASLRETAYTLLVRLPITDPQIDQVLNNLAEQLGGEPLAVVRVTICTALGDIWRKTVTLSEQSPVRIKRVELLGQLLSVALDDSSQDVQRAAARALGVSTDLEAFKPIRRYVERGVRIKQAISPILELLSERDKIDEISSIVPQMFPELIESFQKLQMATSFDSAEKSSIIVAYVLLMLEAAQVFGEPAFLPLIQAWLQDPPESMTTDGGELNARASLYIASIQALGSQPRTKAMPLTLAQVSRAKSNLVPRLPAISALVETLATLGGLEALEGLLDLLDAAGHCERDQENIRIAIATGMLRTAPLAQIPEDIHQRVHNSAASDPSMHVQRILRQVEQLLSQPQ